MKRLIFIPAMGVLLSAAVIGPANLVENSRFNSGVEGWGDDSRTELIWVSGADVNGNAASGSMRITQVEDATSSAEAQSSCFPIAGGLYDIGGWFFVASSEPGDPKIVVSLTTFDGADCSGAILDSPGTNNIVAATDTWFRKSTTQRPVSGDAVSARLEIRVFNSSAEAFEVLADDIFVTNAVFADRFEL